MPMANFSTERKPEAFDWVTERSKCTAGKFFEKLKMQITQDVEVRNALLPHGTHYAFSFVPSSGAGFFTVLVEGHLIHDSVAFNLNGEKIAVASKNGVLFEATVTLCDEGDCRAKIGNQVFDSWQLRKMALEELFFRSY